MPILIVERGNEKGRRIELRPGATVTFGKDPACDLVTTDHLCSDRHFEVFDKDGSWFIRDLGSEHGTYVNEARFSSRYKLRPGDMIHAGETQIGFASEESAARTGTNRMVGGYRLLERIGRGGMGAVYKANQVSLNRTVALKILSRRISADPAFVKRFQSEAQAAGRLNHPNIVQVYDVGFDQGLHYYSMEYIENGSVQDLATRVGVLDVDLALAIATDAARGLVYAEKKHLVHRDIKPDNLMINSEGIVKIADLGLALDAGERARHAGEGASDEEDVFGTPQFISPEQAQGLAVDTRSDIYSLGASFYRLVTGQPPFTGEDIVEIVQKQVHEEPIPVRKLRPECPPQVASVIERAMQKDPAARFQTAQELLSALEAADEAIKGRKSRGGLVAAAVIVVAAAAAGAWFFTRPKPSDGAPVAPVVEPRAETRDSSDATAIASIERERDAARALREAGEFERQALAAGKPDLALVRDRYHQVAEAYGDTPDGRQAADHVATLNAQIAAAVARENEAREAAESRARAAKETAARALADAAALEKADRYSAAVQALRRARGDAAGTEHEAPLDDAITKTIARADARAAELVAAAAAGAGPDREKALSDAAEAYGAADAGIEPEIEPFAAKLRSALEEARARRESQARADSASDALVVDRARKDLYRGVLGAFDPAAAIAGLDAARADLKLAASAEALARDRAMVEAMARLRDRFVASIPADEGRAPKIKLPAANDRKRLLDHVLLKADPKGMTVKRGGAESIVPFSSLSAPEAWDLLFADLVEKDPAARADAVDFLLLLGLADRAAQVAQDLPDAEARQRALARIAREKEAWDILADVRELSQRAQTDDTVLGRLYREVTRLIEQFGDTRAYLLNRKPPGASRPASRPADK
jgi:hypothetical protein